jgi:hypothetical protein
MTLIVKCSLNISYFFHRILVFVYIENIITLSENIKYICTSFRNGCLLCFAENANKFDIFRRIMVLSWNVKSTRTTAKLSKKRKNKRRSYSCFMLSYLKSVLILLSFFFIVAQDESGTKRTIYLPMSAYNKNYLVNAI